MQQIVKRIAERDSLEKICEFEEKQILAKESLKKMFCVYKVLGLILQKKIDGCSRKITKFSKSTIFLRTIT